MLKRTLLTLSLLTLISGCAATRGTPDERRTAVQEMRTDVIGKLYEEKPSSREEIASSPGYGVFSNANINLLLASFGGGFGGGDFGGFGGGGFGGGGFSGDW